MLYVFVFNFNIIVYSQFIQSDIIQVCCSIKNINTEYIIFLPDLIIFDSRAVDIPTGDTHIPSDKSMGIHKSQGYPYHCDRATHRYKMRAVGSRPSTRPKHWQPVNGSQFIIKLYYRTTSSSEKNAFFP